MEMYEKFNHVANIIDGVFDTLVTSSPLEEYMKRINNASFNLSVGQISSDLERIGNMTPEDLKGFIPMYVNSFRTAYMQSFMSTSGFGEVSAEAYASQAAAAMVEIIDTYLAMR